MIKSFRFLLPALLVFTFTLSNQKGFSQNYSADYFKNKTNTAVTKTIVAQKSASNGLYVRIARELLGSDFVITNAAGVMVLMGTFNNDSFTFDNELFSGSKQEYFLSLFRDNKQLANEKLRL